MIYKHFLVLLILLIPNITIARRVKDGKQLSLSSSLTEVDDEIVNINDDIYYKRPKLTHRRQTTQGTKNGVVVQNSATFKILNHPTRTKIVKFPNNNDYKPVLFAPRWDKSPKQPTCSKKGQTYCLDPPDYPEEEIRRLLAKNKINISASNLDININDTLNIDLANRIDVRNQEPLCLSQSIPIKPKMAETETGEWLYVAPNQVVIVDECLNKDSSCEILPNSLQAKCVQKYLLRKLYALQEDGTKKEIREVKFKIPSCCMCMVFNARRRRRHNLRLAGNKRENRNARGINPDFAYPDQIKNIENLQPELSTRFRTSNINCTEQFGSLCTKVENYPKDIIENLRKKGAFKNSPFFGKDELPVVLSTRSGSENGVPMCGAQPRTIYPQAAKNLADEIKIVIQDKEGGYVQGVVAEECVNNQPCNFEDKFPSNYVSKCEQMHIVRQLETIDKAGNAGPDYMKIPSCCACHVSRETSMITTT